MARYCLRRLATAVLLVFVVSSSALVLTRLAPGQAGDLEQPLDADARRAQRSALGLDRPLLAQYGDWVAGVLRFEFGTSLLYSRPVAGLLTERAANTAVLAATALTLATLVGIPLGAYTGTRTRGVGPAVVRVLSLVFLSVPPLVGSLVLLLIAARTGWFPVGGMTSAVTEAPTWSAWVADLVRHLPVPAVALALPLAATLERLQSESLDRATRLTFVRAGRARGVPPGRALWRHAWPASLGSVLGFYGLMIGALFSGSFVVEVVTTWPGLGRLMFDALRARDLYLVAGAAAAGASCLAVGTLAADLLHAIVDPRLRERT